MDKLKIRISHNVYIFTLLSMAVLFSILNSSFIRKFNNNYLNISTGVLSSEKSHKYCFQEIQQQNLEYPAIVDCVIENHNLSVEDVVNILDQSQINFPDRIDLFLAIKGLIIGQTNYSQACSIISKIPSRPILFNLAQASLRRNDFIGAEKFMVCMENLNDQGGWISPYDAAELYLNIAENMRRMGDLGSASKYYNKVVSTYPGIWSFPIIRYSEIQFMENPYKSEVFILGYLKRAEDSKAIFDLSRQIGIYWEDNNNLLYAYCAYTKALLHSKELDRALAPSEWIEDLEQRSSRILQLISEDEIDCDALWNRIGIEPK